MFKKVAGTVITRLITAVLTLLIVILNAKFLGAEKLGTLSMVILSIAIVLMVNNFIGGAAVAYFIPRVPYWHLFVPSCLWAILCSAGVTAILKLTGSIPAGYTVHVMILSMMQSLTSVNTMVLLGKERIRAVNSITVFQVLALALVIMFYYFFTETREVMVYILGLYGSYLVVLIWSLFLVLPGLKRVPMKGIAEVLKDLVRYGGWAQVGNIIQLFNYRVSYYFIRHFLGNAPLGIFSVGVQLSEGVWLIPRSMSMVQFSRIANVNDQSYSARLTLLFMKFSFLVTLIVLGVILLLPGSFYTWVFGPQFGGVRLTIFSLAAGILVLSASIVISPYFSGRGRPWVNTVASAAGLGFTLVLSFLLVPAMGLAGAGIAASASYSATTLFQLVIFMRQTHLKAKDLLVNRDEIRFILAEIRAMLPS